MRLSNLWSFVLVRSGQQLTGKATPDDFGMSMHDFWEALVKPEINLFQKYIMLKKQFSISVSNQYYDFATDPNNVNAVRSFGDLTVTPSQTGSTHYAYVVAALDKHNVPIAVTAIKSITNGPADTTDHPNALSWDSYASAKSYAVYRTTGGDEQGFIGKVAQTTFSDAAAKLVTDVSYINQGPPELCTGQVPNMVTEALPTNTVDNLFILQTFMPPGDNSIGNPARLIQPAPNPYPYDKGILYVVMTGQMMVTTFNNYTVCPIVDEEERVIEVLMPELDTSMDKLMNLIVAKFIEIVGRSNRSFVYRDFPVDTDGAESVRDGTAMYKAAVDALYKNTDFWTAIKT